MAWSIPDLFPPWGDTGERPPDNFQYQGGDQVNEKHLDYNRDSLHAFEDEVRSALQDIDSDQDGVVDEAEFAQDANVTVNSYKGNDIDTNGDGIVDEADSANAYKHNDIDSDGDGTVDQADQSNDTLAYKGNDIDSDGDGTVDEADSALTYKGNDIDSDGDGTVDKADEAVTMEARTSDPASPVDGQMWIRTDL